MLAREATCHWEVKTGSSSPSPPPKHQADESCFKMFVCGSSPGDQQLFPAIVLLVSVFSVRVCVRHDGSKEPLMTHLSAAAPWTHMLLSSQSEELHTHWSQGGVRSCH